MTKGTKTKLIAELKRITAEIDAQKKLIKEDPKDELMVRTATLEMETLHARLSELEASLAKKKGTEKASR
jgi:hypothetical protein